MKKRPNLKKIIIGSFFALILLGFGSILGIYLWVAPSLPSVEMLKDVRLQEPMRVYTRERRLIAEFGEQKRAPLAWEEMPPQVIRAFLAAEDDRFFQHPGVDYQGLLRAGINHLLTGDRSQGGGTITMQLTREFFLSREKTYIRKIREIFLAIRIEREMSKEEILTLYLNKIFLGNRAYGVGAAAQVYFGVDARDLTIAQAAALAATAQRPSENNPASGTRRIVDRRNYVLGRLHSLDWISEAEYNEAMVSPLVASLHGPSVEVEAPDIAEMVRAEILARYGAEAYTRGLRVVTTIDGDSQQAANRSLRLALHEYDFRHGYRGPIRSLELGEESEEETLRWDNILNRTLGPGLLFPALVLSVGEREAEVYTGGGRRMQLGWVGLSWARRADPEDGTLGPAPQIAADVVKPGDLVYLIYTGEEDGPRLAQLPIAQGAIVSIDAAEGALRAVIGGYDFSVSQYNRTVQAARQPGSAFKPFIYSAALERGFTAASVVNDAPVVFEEDDALERDWRPRNDSGRFYGPTRLREALTYSRNLVSVRVMRTIGVGYTVGFVQRFGFDRNRLPRDLSLSLGSAVMSPLELAAGYAVFANGGFRVQPWFIAQIEDSDGTLLFETTAPLACDECPEDNEGSESVVLAERVIGRDNAFLMDDMLRDVVRRGTGRAALQLGRSDLAGKTGSTNDFADAWFAGYGGGVVAVAWVGHDRVQSLGPQEYGGRAALPMWIEYMRVATRNLPEVLQLQPPGIVTARISAETGRLAGAGDIGAMFEYFRQEDIVRLEEEARAALERGEDDDSDEPIIF